MLRLLAGLLLAVLMLLPRAASAEVILASESVEVNMDYISLNDAKHTALTNAIRAAHRNPCYDGQKMTSRITQRSSGEMTILTVTLVSETCGKAQ